MMRKNTPCLLYTTAFWTGIILYSIFFRDCPPNDSTIQTEWMPLENKLLDIKGLDVIRYRLQRVRAICERIGTVSNKVNEVYAVKSANMAYCAVQKAGSTMWIRILKFIVGQSNETGNPMKLSKYQIHYTESEFYKILKDFGLDWNYITRYLRVMTVRDPYTRLWSAYIDKFLMPDFWETKGRHIVRMIRKNPDRKALSCGHDVTFPEFIQYVIKIGHSFSYLNQDKHWLPASDLCDPCVFKPDIIGKQETFISDMKYSLRRLKLENVIANIVSIDHTDFEIKDEIDYNAKIFRRVKQCISKSDLFERMWKAFTLNGYLPSNELYPSDMLSHNFDVEEFFKIIKRVRQKYNVTNQEKNARRRHSLTQAFSQLTKEQLQGLRSLYTLDFSLFDYESYPTYLNTE